MNDFYDERYYRVEKGSTPIGPYIRFVPRYEIPPLQPRIERIDHKEAAPSAPLRKDPTDRRFRNRRW